MKMQGADPQAAMHLAAGDATFVDAALCPQAQGARPGWAALPAGTGVVATILCLHLLPGPHSGFNQN